MEREHGLETLLYVLQQVEESPTFRSFNLTLLEITYYVLSAHSVEELGGKSRDADAPVAGKAREAPPPTAEEGAGAAETTAETTGEAIE